MKTKQKENTETKKNNSEHEKSSNNPKIAENSLKVNTLVFFNNKQ